MRKGFHISPQWKRFMDAMEKRSKALSRRIQRWERELDKMDKKLVGLETMKPEDEPEPSWRRRRHRSRRADKGGEMKRVEKVAHKDVQAKIPMDLFERLGRYVSEQNRDDRYVAIGTSEVVTQAVEQFLDREQKQAAKNVAEPGPGKVQVLGAAR